MMRDARRYAPAAARNRGPILEALRARLPRRGPGHGGPVLEVASGTGEHVVHFAAALPDLTFQPSDPDAGARASIDAWVAATGVGNVRPAIALDAAAEPWPWPATGAGAVIAINMLHIAPWAATIGLVQGAARVLSADGMLFLYGPFRQGGRHTAESNARFDADLRRQCAEWGVRDLEAVAALAADAGFAEPALDEMPANNLSVVFRRRG